MGLSKRSIAVIWIVTVILTSSIGFALFWNYTERVMSKTLITMDNSDYNPEDIASKRPSGHYIDNKDLVAYPQYKSEYPMVNGSLLGGEISDDFMESVMYSDEKYGTIIPKEVPRTYMFDKFFTVNFDIFKQLNLNKEEAVLEYIYRNQPLLLTAVENLWFIFRIEPDEEAYMCFDNIINYSAPYTKVGDTERIYSRFVGANNPYVMEYDDRYFEFKDTSGTSPFLSFEVTTGGITLYNESLYRFYTTIGKAIQAYHYKYSNDIDIYDLAFWLLSQVTGNDKNSIIDNYYILSLVLYLDNNPDFVTWYETYATTYDSFLSYLGIDLSKGFRSYVNFDPSAVSRIDCKSRIYIDMPYGEPNLPHVDSYSIQVWNYFLNDWVTMFTRHETVPMNITNTWIDDSFFIDTNAWQYIDPWLNGNSSFIKYRVVVNVTRGIGDTGDIKVRLGGMWTSIKQEYIDFIYDMTFVVNDRDITRNDLKSNPIFVMEYHTEGFTSAYDHVRLTRPIALVWDVLYNAIDARNNPEDYIDVLSQIIDMYRDPLEHIEEILGINNYDVVIDDNIEFDASPYYDKRVGITIPMSMVNYDTRIYVRLHGRFAKYTYDGVVKIPKLIIDKIAMLYDYEVPQVVKSYSVVNFNNIGSYYVCYEIDIHQNFVNLQMQYPSDYTFIDPSGLNGWTGLVESPRGKDITHYWIDSIMNVNSTSYITEPLYDDSSFRLTAKIVFFERTGTYRFWFKVPNLLDRIEILNSTGGKYSLYDRLILGDKTTQRIYLSDFNNRYPKLSKSIWEGGTFWEIVEGSNFYGTEKTSLTLSNGTQISYEFYDSEHDQILTYWNAYEIEYTFKYEDNLWGSLTFKFIWQSEDTQHLGFGLFYMYTIREERAPPQLTVINPISDSRWGASKVNYIIVKAYHPSTVGVYAQFKGSPITYNLTNLEKAIESDADASLIPDDLMHVNRYERKYYWYQAVEGGILKTLFPIGDDGKSLCTVTLWAASNVSGTLYVSDKVNIDFTLVDRSNFKLLPVYDINVNQRQLLKYYCPEGIQTIRISIFDGVSSTPVAVIGNGSTSIYLSEGYQSYIVPFRFTFEGTFSIIVEVYDDVGNYMVYETNQFKVIKVDTRTWFSRLMDESIEIMVTWTGMTGAILGLGLVKISKRSTNDLEPYNVVG